MLKQWEAEEAENDAKIAFVNTYIDENHRRFMMGEMPESPATVLQWLSNKVIDDEFNADAIQIAGGNFIPMKDLLTRIFAVYLCSEAEKDWKNYLAERENERDGI